MDDELPQWNKHGSQHSIVPYNAGGECQEVGYSNYISVHHDKVMTEVNYGEQGEEFSYSTWLQTQPQSHESIGQSSGENMSSLSSCMSGAFKALLPDYHGTSSAMPTDTVKYSNSPDNYCLIKPTTVMDENIAVERLDRSIFLKDPLAEASASVAQMLPPICAQYVQQKKERVMDQGNCNWTSVIKDALEMSNGMAVEQNLSMDACDPVFDFNPVYKGPETEATYTVIDHCQMPEVKLNKKKVEHPVKSGSFISMLSDGINKRKDVLKMGGNEKPSILHVGSPVEMEESGKTEIRDWNLPTSEGLLKSETLPLVTQSFENSIQETTQGQDLLCNDVLPGKMVGTSTCLKPGKVNRELPESSTVHGLNHLHAQKGCHQTEVTDGKKSQDHSSHCNVQDNAELSLKVETKPDLEIQNSLLRSKKVSDQPDLFKTIHTDFKCQDPQVEQGKTGKLKRLCFQESGSKNMTQTLTSTPERATDECDIHVQEKQSPGRSDCSLQHKLQKAVQKHKKGRKRKKSELEELIGPIPKSNKKDDGPVCGSEISDNAVKSDTTGCKEANQNVSLADCDSMALEDFITNGDVSLPSPKRKVVADTTEALQQKEYNDSEASQEEVQSSARIKKPVSRRKQKKRSKLHSKARNSATFSNQQLPQNCVLSTEEDCMSHSQITDTTLVKEASDPAVIQQAISSLESSVSEKKKKKLQTKKRNTSQTLGDAHDEDVPTTLTEFAIKSFECKNDNAPSLNSQSSLDSVCQTDSGSTLVTESSNFLQNNPKKSKQRKMANVNLITHNVNPQENVPLLLTQSKENMLTSNRSTVKGKTSIKKAAIKDSYETTFLDIQPSAASLKQEDYISTSVPAVESPVLSSPKKSPKKKRSNIKHEAVNIPTTDPTAQQSVLNHLSESDATTAQPNIRSFRTRKTLDKKVSCDKVSEDCELSHSNEANSSVSPSKKIYDVKSKAVHTPTPYQTMQQEIHPSAPLSATEMDTSNVLNKKKTKGQIKKVTKHRTHADQAICNVGEQFFPVQMQQENSTVLSEPISMGKDATEGPCIKTDTVNETAESHVENQVSITTEAKPQSSLKKAKKTRRKQLLKQKEQSDQSSFLKTTHREDKMSDVPSVDRVVVSENFDLLEDNCKFKVSKKKSPKFEQITERHGFANAPMTQEKNTESDVMVISDFCKLPDDETIRSQQPEKDATVIDQIDVIKEETTIEVAKIPKKRGRKPGRKKRIMAGQVAETVKEEEHKDICYDNKIVCNFQNKTQASAKSQNTEVIPEGQVLKSRESTKTHKFNSGPAFKKLPIQDKSMVSLGITECHTEFEENISSSMQNIDREDQYKFKQKARKRGRPPKKQRLSMAHLKDNTSPSATILDDSSCQDGIENIAKAAASPVKQNDIEPLKKSVDENVIVTGTDHSESSQSATDPLSQSMPAPKGKKRKNFTKAVGNLRLSSLRASSRTSETSVKDFQKADIPSLSQDTTHIFNEDGKIALAMPGAIKKDEFFERTAMQEGCFLVDMKTKNEAPIKVVKGKKCGRKRRKLKKTSLDLLTKHEELKTDQLSNHSPHLSSNLMKNVKKYEEEEQNFELSGKDLFAVHMESYADNTEVSHGVSSNVVKETENAIQSSMDNGLSQDGEDCVAMPIKLTNKRTILCKPKEIVKKPLTCKYCGVSFRHITAYTIHQRIHTGDKPYKCKICGKTFAQLSYLKSHCNVHKQDASIPCPCCSQMFLQKKNLLCHFKVHLQESKAKSKPQKDIRRVKLQNHMHEMEKPLSCKECGKNFLKPSSLTAHEKTHWPVKPYACSICGKGFNQLKALKKHSQNHAGETPFSCFHCGHAFSALSALRMHQASKTCIARKNDETRDNVEGFIVSQGVDGQVNTPVFFKCQLCKQLFKKWCQYTLHLQTHTSSPPYICFSCGQCYEKDSDMNVHCEVCCQSSGEEKICGASLSEIMQGITKTKPLKCTSFQTLPTRGMQQNSQMPTSSEQLLEPAQTKYTDLSKHPKTISAQSPNKLPSARSPARSDFSRVSTGSSLECMEITSSLQKFKCSRCGQQFKHYRTLSAHLQTHASGFRYTCAQCGQFFERWSKLWLHQRHHRLKKHSHYCNQCNVQFHFFNSFKEHMIGHAREKPNAYPSSPKTFIQEASLHAHQSESHELKCDVCSKTFSNLRNLIRHGFLHNRSTSHVCLVCNLSFTNARLLKEHLKTHATNNGAALPDIPMKPLDFSHKCKRCKACFSTGDLLYAHQIRHSRDAKTSNSTYRTSVVPTSKVSDSCNETPSAQASARKNNLLNLKLDSIPSDDSLYVYSHPDSLYVSPSRKVQLPVINLDSDEREEVSDSQNTRPEVPNSEITSQSESTQLPQATPGLETTSPILNESIKMTSGKHHYSPKKLRSTFVETSIDMELERPAQHEDLECFECADCTEKLTSVLSLYEHYILHAMGDAYVQVH